MTSYLHTISENFYKHVGPFPRGPHPRYTSQRVSETQSLFENVKSCKMNKNLYNYIERGIVRNFIPHPKIFVISILYMYNVNSQIHTL